MIDWEAELAARLCAERAGLQVDPARTYLLESRLTPVARREGFASLFDFMRTVRDRADERLIWALVEAMTPAEADFFRDPVAFKALAAEVLPALSAERGGEPLRVWCAAAGAGQEAYSLAMALEEAETPIPVEIIASDISERRLEKAQAGLYSQFEVQRGLSAQRLVRHFEKPDELFRTGPRLRGMVSWRRINLLEAAGPGPFDLVLCRGLLSALSVEARRVVAGRLSAAVAPGGWLVLGVKEAPHVQGAGLSTAAGWPGFHRKAAAVYIAA